jgi:hypothetical protein
MPEKSKDTPRRRVGRSRGGGDRIGVPGRQHRGLKHAEIMSGTHPNRSAADIGGDDAGPVDTLDRGMKFWERQANALRSAIQRNQIARTDELRRAAEDLGERYAKLEYFERTTLALRAILVEKNLITEHELKAKMAEVRARFDVPKKRESPIKKGAGR